MSRQDFETAAMPHLDALYNMAVKLTGNPADAEDLVQDTYLNGCRFFGSFEKGTNIKAWLFKILHNNFINSRRKMSREPQTVAAEDEDLDYFINQAAEASGAGPPTPEQALFGKFVPEDIRQALDDLPDDFKQAFLLYDIEGFSYQEIADMLECSIGTIKSRLFRSRKMLQQKLIAYAREQGFAS